MNHEFISNPNIPEKCIECAYPEDKHGDNAACDCCEKTGNLQIWMLGNQQALLTRECMEREKAILEKEIADNHQTPEKQQARLDAYNAIANPYQQLIQNASKIDEQLHLSSDIFTARTVSIEECRKAIFNNPDIPSDKKFFEFVLFCKQRMAHFQSIIFDLDKKKIEAYSEQKAWHIAMNDYANKLRADEREKLRIADVTYDVKTPKSITPRAIKANTKKVTKQELRVAVNQLNSELMGTGKDGIQEFVVQMMMVSKNWTLEQAINHLRRSLKEGMSELTKE
tara:strand:+ start:14 stop:859 length:846 start_codon:yes stop_codon:yes gene_type:complete